jgi:phosphoribosylformylglycinamidine synthase PurS subunit
VARVVVDVMLKPEILDPQGRAVRGALGRLGLAGVQDVRQGKQFVIDLEGTLEGERLDLMHKLAEELLSNPVIENYSMRVVEEGSADGPR